MLKLLREGSCLDLKNCKRCGKLFSFHDHNVCRDCLEQDNAEFAKIRDYVRRHPGVTALELSRETGVAPVVITRFQREGRLTTEEKKVDEEK